MALAIFPLRSTRTTQSGGSGFVYVGTKFRVNEDLVTGFDSTGRVPGLRHRQRLCAEGVQGCGDGYGTIEGNSCLRCCFPQEIGAELPFIFVGERENFGPQF